MAKAYWIASIDVEDPDLYGSYIEAASRAIALYGGRYLVRGGPYALMEGTGRGRQILIEFDSYDVAMACYHSAEYGAALPLRRRAASSDLMIVSGVDGSRPLFE